MLNHTHALNAKSWVSSANLPESDFPVQNLPIAVARRAATNESWRGMVAIGDMALDLAAVLASPSVELSDALKAALTLAAKPQLNELMAAGNGAWRDLRHGLFSALSSDVDLRLLSALEPCLIVQSDLEFHLPAEIGDYTDFYTSWHHANNVAQVAGVPGPRGTNFEWLPIAYHGRASSVVISGTPFHRPCGQMKAPQATSPVYAPSGRLDYELELGVFVGPGNLMGQRINMEDAENQIFGICLLNDWSARDIQFWEMMPLGPFLGKNFCTSISPWIVMAEALEPFRRPLQRPADAPASLPYLDSPKVQTSGAFDIRLEVALSSAKQRGQGISPTRLSSTSFIHQHWTVGQMIAQHTVNGCNLKPGDLIGTGTISGPTQEEAGAIIELARGGSAPVNLEGGETRGFVQDGDRVIFKGWCESPNARRIGFGVCSGEVLPAVI